MHNLWTLKKSLLLLFEGQKAETESIDLQSKTEVVHQVSRGFLFPTTLSLYSSLRTGPTALEPTTLFAAGRTNACKWCQCLSFTIFPGGWTHHSKES
ncbi:hypothetical protein GN956_G19207 [Arapaima gigas]